MEFVEIARLNKPFKKFVFEEGMTVGELAQLADITLESNDVINTDEGYVVKASALTEEGMSYSVTKNYKNGSY